MSAIPAGGEAILIEQCRALSPAKLQAKIDGLSKIIDSGKLPAPSAPGATMDDVRTMLRIAIAIRNERLAHAGYE
mgnify:CR=1 FL=1